MKRIVIFASGSGSNAENIITHFQDSGLAKVVHVLTNKKDAKVLDRAQRLQVPSLIFNKEELNNNRVLDALKRLKPDLIVLAGFLLKFPEQIIEEFPNKIINVHPALLPKYGGKGMYGNNVHKAVVANKEDKSGITIHYVNENYDEGAIIFQAETIVDENDTYEDVAAKIHALEQKHFPLVIEQILNTDV
ncbi:phosphoribosylglycinamide formyltransferase [Pseudofulvibacter geojedonensis]|uniref:Phosphoribosylglycinamide formyltransferase n=1 Tax=Pseudofulvibacter geojedonensis TaxID=1123758 RepID=A0ABW3I5Q4_9FLAO